MKVFRVLIVMEFRIADTFTDSLARLTGDEQKAVKTTAFDLQINPGQSGDELPQARQGQGQELLVGARQPGHPADRAPDGAEPAALLRGPPRRGLRLGRAAQARDPPETGAAQLVEIRETGAGDRGPGATSASRRRRLRSTPLFAHLPEDELLAYGVPPEWLADVRRGHRGHGARRWPTTFRPRPPRPCWSWRPGARPGSRAPPLPAASPFEHPDAQRRFRVVADVEELERALEYPWEKWIVFLHPAQRELVERGFGGPARVSGSAGTGKTVVALHRAAHLARAQSRCACAAHHVLRGAGERPPAQARAADRHGAAACASGSTWTRWTRSPVDSTTACLAEPRSPRVKRSASSCTRPPATASIRSSRLPSCYRSGARSSMRGSSSPGRPTATWLASAGRRGCREAAAGALVDLRASPGLAEASGSSSPRPSCTAGLPPASRRARSRRTTSWSSTRPRT